MQGVARLGEGDIPPVEAGFAHIDGDAPVRFGARRNRARGGFERRLRPAAFRHQQRRGAARAVAAGARLAAIGVADAHEGVGGRRGFEHQYLIAADARTTVGDRARVLRRQRERRRAGVEYHEIVAEAVHLDESAFHRSGYRRAPGAVQRESDTPRSPRSGGAGRRRAEGLPSPSRMRRGRTKGRERWTGFRSSNRKT